MLGFDVCKKKVKTTPETGLTKTMPNKGITISVTAETNSGGRRHMEDYLSVKLAPNEDLRKIPELREQAYVAVFDGHGGKEAAKYARERLWDAIQSQPKFLDGSPENICQGIRDAFESLHLEMLQQRDTWKPNKMGDPSTAGTTASAVIFRQDRIFVANVGDSTVVLAVNNPYRHVPGEPAVLAKVLTKDHKPDDPDEAQMIESLGGKVVVSKKGVPRVVWERQRIHGCRSSEHDNLTDSIPFLSVSRSLGDFWSFNPKTQKYTVSPCPDISVLPLNLSEQRFVMIASDGLWNVMTPNEVVSFVWDYEHNNQFHDEPRDVVRALINEALMRWKSKGLLADNIAVLIAFLTEQPLPPEAKDATPLIEDDVDQHHGYSNRDAQHINTNPPPLPPRQMDPPIIEHSVTSRSGSHYYYKETLADGGTIEYETKIKLRARKHKSRHEHSVAHKNTMRRIPTNRHFEGDEGQEEDMMDWGLEGEGLLRPMLKRCRPMEEPFLLASTSSSTSSSTLSTTSAFPIITEEGHMSDSSSGVYSDGSSPTDIKDMIGMFRPSLEPSDPCRPSLESSGP